MPTSSRLEQTFARLRSEKRPGLVTYTTAALMFIVFMSVIVLTLDYGFTKLMFWVFG